MKDKHELYARTDFKMVKIKLLLLFIIIISFSSCNKNDSPEHLSVKIIPGYGVLINQDSIILGKARLDELRAKLKFITNPSMYTWTMWDGVNPKTGKDTGGSYCEVKIKYKSIYFNFWLDEDTSKSILVSVELTDLKNMNVILDGLDILEPNPKILRVFPKRKEEDYISPDSLEYQMKSYGISVLLKKINKSLLIDSVKVDLKLSE